MVSPTLISSSNSSSADSPTALGAGGGPVAGTRTRPRFHLKLELGIELSLCFGFSFGIAVARGFGGVADVFPAGLFGGMGAVSAVLRDGDVAVGSVGYGLVADGPFVAFRRTRGRRVFAFPLL